MNPAFSLAMQMPRAQPVGFEFEGKTWKLWPLDTAGIAAQLERWVIQYVRGNVEKLRPADDDPDRARWTAYNDDKAELQKAIQRGRYGAFTLGWVEVIDDNFGLGFAEAVYLCVSHKCDGSETGGERWTRERNLRLVNAQETDPAFFKRFYDLWLELNFPKASGASAT